MTDAFIEVYRGHSAFYQNQLGFPIFGHLRICPRVNAPAVLLHLDCAHMAAQISRHADSRHTHEKSLYPYFLQTYKEESSANRIGAAA